jgi:hypothetical protein
MEEKVKANTKKAWRKINRESFTIRALRLVKRLDSHCRDNGLEAYLREKGTWNHDYDSDVKLTMGEAFEIMELSIFAAENDITEGD